MMHCNSMTAMELSVANIVEVMSTATSVMTVSEAVDIRSLSNVVNDMCYKGGDDSMVYVVVSVANVATVTVAITK